MKIAGVLFTLAAAAPADVLHPKEGKPIVGTIREDLFDTIKFQPDLGPETKFPKSKLARIVLTWSGVAPRSGAAEPPADLKSLLYDDRTVGLRLPLPKDWFMQPGSHHGFLLLGARAKSEGTLRARPEYSLDPPEKLAQRMMKSEVSGLEGADWKFESGSSPLRATLDFKQGGNKLHRDYAFLAAPGRVVLLASEMNANSAKAGRARLDSALAAAQLVEPELTSRYESHGFGLLDTLGGGYEYKGVQPTTLEKSKTTGEAHVWAHPQEKQLMVQVFAAEVPDLKERVMNEFFRFRNMETKKTEAIKLGELEAFRGEGKLTVMGKAQWMKVCAFVDGGRFYNLFSVSSAEPGEADEQLYDHFVAAVRTAGMAKKE